MAPDPSTQPALTQTVKRRRLGPLVLRIGILGLVLAASAIAAASFALFGCACNEATTSKSTNIPEGMIVNPPDPPMRPRP